MLNHKTGALLFDAANSFTVQVSGSSMEPTIKYLQTVSVVKVSKLRLGDCYLFEINNHLMVHRLVTVINGVCFFMGDRSATVESVSADRVIGRVVVPDLLLSRMAVTLLNRVYLKVVHTPLDLPSTIKTIRIFVICGIIKVDGVVKEWIASIARRLKIEKKV